MRYETYFRPDHMQNQKNNMVIGMAYVPDQSWNEIYEIEYGFTRGTIFAELDKPWLGGGHGNE